MVWTSTAFNGEMREAGFVARLSCSPLEASLLIERVVAVRDLGLASTSNTNRMRRSSGPWSLTADDSAGPRPSPSRVESEIPAATGSPSSAVSRYPHPRRVPEKLSAQAGPIMIESGRLG